MKRSIKSEVRNLLSRENIKKTALKYFRKLLDKLDLKQLTIVPPFFKALKLNALRISKL